MKQPLSRSTSHKTTRASRTIPRHFVKTIENCLLCATCAFANHLFYTNFWCFVTSLCLKITTKCIIAVDKSLDYTNPQV